MNLEKEFKIYELMHKKAIVKASMMIFIKDMLETGVNIPYFMNDYIEQKAEKEVNDLILSDNHRFNDIYEKCWDRYKNQLQ